MPVIKSIDIPLQLEKVRRVTEELADAVVKAEDDSDFHFRINLGLTEAITNAIVHRFPNVEGPVFIEYERQADRHIFHLHDPGQGPCRGYMDMENLDDDLYRENHRGTTLISWAADEVYCRGDDDGFCLTLVFEPSDKKFSI